MQSNVNFGAALIKIASRCNLNCDYCYMYQHEDQSWKNQPKFVTIETITKIAERILEYLQTHKKKDFDIIFHGGEPLLFGVDNIINMVHIFKNILTLDTNITYAIQTNGVLLNPENISKLFAEGVSISVSLDGPKEYNDLHRLDFNGESSFEKVLQGIKFLKDTNSNLFSGVISVIDPRTNPNLLFEFIDNLDLPKFDLLLPDATHKNKPFLREVNPNIYVDWINDAYDVWFNNYSHIPVRWFDAILATRVGIPSDTDVMGFGSVNLLVIETDGSFTDHDVLKITQPEGARLNLSVYDSSIEDVQNHPQIQYHGHLLTSEGISEKCKKCPIVSACGGGSVPHRFDSINKFNMPSIYCKEIFSVMSKSAKLLRLSINDEIKTVQINQSFILDNSKVWRQQIDNLAVDLSKKYNIQNYNTDSFSAASLLLNIDNNLLLNYKSPKKQPEIFLNSIRIQAEDYIINETYQDIFEIVNLESEDYKYFKKNKHHIEAYLKDYSQELAQSMDLLISDIIICKYKEKKSGIFSFSDDKAPNVIYVSVYDNGTPLDLADITDSIIHEYLHQVLFHLDRETPFLHDKDYPQFTAPWRSGFRSANGFLHGTYVFTHLSHFWKYLYESHSYKNKEKAFNNADKFLKQAIYGISSLYHFSLLTNQGKQLLVYLLNTIQIDNFLSLDELLEHLSSIESPILPQK